MPARDAYHLAVRHALEKAGWTVTDDPYLIKQGVISMYIDLGAEHLVAATKGQEKIAIEIKCFTQPSYLAEFHTALGQFINYKIALEKQESERKLYLAITQSTYDSFFTIPFIQQVTNKTGIKLILFDADQEVITQWIN